MKAFTGLIMIVTGLGLGIYMCFWWGFVGGIIQIVQAFKETTIIPMDVALGVLRFMFSGVIGFLCGALFVLTGAALTRE